LGLVSSRPLAHSVPYPRDDSPKAAPKCISGRTSYLQVRLAFHLYPQLIPPFCNTDGFGPPARVSEPSTWPWVAHLVSGLLRTTQRPIQTRFRYGSALPALNLATRSNSPAHSSISTPSVHKEPPTACKRTVSGSFHPPSGVLFTFPSRY
jgi:hypothetical protein